MGQKELPSLLKKCEAELAASRRALDALEQSLSQVKDALREPGVETSSATPIQEVLESHRDELVSMVVAALENTAKRRGKRDGFAGTLVHRSEDDSYRLGRRRIALTDTEKQILDLLWQAMPEPISRQAIHDALYPHGNKPAAATIDVFVSKLRQKLKLISGGTEFLESVRSKGWALKPELCRDTRVLGGEEEARRA